MEPLRGLLKEKNEFLMTVEHIQAFEKAREKLSSAPILAYYDPSRPTALHTDASRLNGLGFLLFQQQNDKSWRVVQAGSRFITETESRYAMVELEMLGVVWATKKCRLFLSGLPNFEVVVDHKPLIPILNKHAFNEIENPRLQRLRMNLAPYSFTATWKPGKNHNAPDALSRAPVDDPHPEDELAEKKVEGHVRAMIAATRDTDPRVNEIMKASMNDPEYVDLIELIIDGFPQEKNLLPLNMRPYWGVRDSLSIDEDGLILYGCRLLVPNALRRVMLERLHESHQGIERTKRRARLSIYWPRIDNDIENMVKSCRECELELPSQGKEPIIHHEPPERIFQHQSADLFTYRGNQFLVVTDLYSGWASTYLLGRSARADDVIAGLRSSFIDTSVPTRMYSDNGPQLVADETKQFYKDWGVELVTSSPEYPQGNGHAESGVKSMKKLVKRCWNKRTDSLNMNKWSKALIQWRNTPRANGLSPAQVVFGHPSRDSIPIHKRAFSREWQKSMAEADRKAEQQRMRSDHLYDRTAHNLPRLPVRAQVIIQNPTTKKWDRAGQIVEVGKHRDYFIRLPSGRIWRRNRRFLRARCPAQNPVPGDIDPPRGTQRPRDNAPNGNLNRPVQHPSRQQPRPGQVNPAPQPQGQGQVNPAPVQRQGRVTPPRRPPGRAADQRYPQRMNAQQPDAVKRTRSGRSVQKPNRLIEQKE